MMRRLLIVGDGGHGKSVLECAIATKAYSDIAFLVNHELDDNFINGFDYYIEDKSDFKFLLKKYKNIIVAIGDNKARMSRIAYFKSKGFYIDTLIHPSAEVSRFSQIEEGTVVLANCSVNAFSKVGRGCILNTKSNVDHDTVLEDGVHLSPGVSMGGTVYIGENTWIGVGSSIRNGIRIGAHTLIGMGSVVVKDIGDHVVAYGNPCEVKRAYEQL